MMISKTLRILYDVITIFLIVWFVASWADIVIDNLSTNPVHHSWNMILRLMEWF